MKRRLFTLASAVSLALFLALAALLIRSWFVYEHLALATNSGPAWVVRSFHGRITLDHRCFWDSQGGFTWGRRRVSFHDNPANYLYREPKRQFGFFDAGFYSGTAYTWPGHLYPNVSKLPDLSDPRYWRDDYSAVLIPDLFLLCLLAILPVLYLRERLRQHRPHPATGVTEAPGRVFTVLAAVSFALLLFVSDLWLQTYTRGRMWIRSAGNRAAIVTLCRNQVHIVTGQYRPSIIPYATAGIWRSTDFMLTNAGPYPPMNLMEQIGFSYRTSHPDFSTFRHVSFPLWPLWLVSTILPIRWLLAHHRVHLRRMRKLRGQCQRCGYDLTANTSQRCPECGAIRE